MSYKVGDKFVIEIGAIAELPDGKKKYFIKPFESLVIDKKGLDQLERVKEPKEEFRVGGEGMCEMFTERKKSNEAD